MKKPKRSILLKALLILSPALTFAGTEGMPNMPLVQPKKSYTIESKDQGESLQEDRGYGDKESEVAMMSLMMVEGSGYEGMDMGEMKSGKPHAAQAVHAGHSMPMARSDAIKPDVMKEGMVHAGSLAMNDTQKAENVGVSVELTKTLGKAKVGPNIYEFVIKDSKTGKNLVGVKPTAEVYMTSMDMGTETPKVKEPKPGLYQVKAIYSMQGPWALKIKTPRGEKVFDVEATK